MRLIATGIIWVALCGLLQAENPAKPTKPVKPAVAETEKPSASTQPTVINVPIDAPYVELKPMTEPDKNIRFGKIYDFVNDPDVTPVADNKPMIYEFKYFNHGAITKEQLAARKGHYYVINWKNAGPAEDLVLRFDYRQEKSRDRINTLEIAYPAAKGNLRGMFSVRGGAYAKFGKINSWRLTVLRKGKIVAEQQSFIW
jgi:hypothetical protein